MNMKCVFAFGQRGRGGGWGSGQGYRAYICHVKKFRF